ncbi:outer membrane protein assembly factor BamC [Vibrio salinus]|uniref:outer membrane protein assembly factor BamC n=1 Tax=Vibrio salinus TaxID=2899784 RepID=UPI001E412698|nr:outer membrane protein assembly factor BamC [Vibrio salinus]MCE0494474.1 outer membrane protein assembly factor BamC [Vibrio salinus]
MKFSCQLVSSTLAVLVLSACSNNAVERKQAEDDYAYLDTTALHAWNYPKNATPEVYPQYAIPSGQYHGETGEAVDIRPPQEILELLSGVRIQQKNKTAELWMVKRGLADKLWSQIISFLDSSGARYSRQSHVIQTDWVSWSPKDEPSPVIGRYQFEKLAKANQEGIQIRLLDLKQNRKSQINNVSLANRYTAEMANAVVIRYDAKARSDEATRIQNQMNNINIQMGTDRSGLPVIIARAPFNVTWQRLPVSLMKIDMMSQDKAESQGTIKVEYKTPDNDVWSSLGVKPVDLKSGTYTFLLGDLGNRTSINITDSKGKPVTESALNSFVPVLSKLLEK